MIRNILVVEDKKSHMEALNKIVCEVEKNLSIFNASNVEEAYQIAMEHHIHLFLVDIILNPKDSGDVAGLKFSQEIRGMEKYMFTPLIFITSLEDPKLFSYSQLHCLEYIEKPFDAERIKKIVAHALKFPVIEDMERFVYFRKDGIVYSKKVSEIIYIESSRRKLKIHCQNDMLEVPYKTVSEILAEIDSELLIQCSRYTIVNKMYIEKIDYANRYITLKGVREPVEIGAIMKKSFRKKLERK